MSIEQRANIKFCFKHLPKLIRWWKKFMAMIVYPVAAFTSGLNVFKRDGRLWKTMNVRAGQQMLWTKKTRKLCVNSSEKIHRILTENLGYIKVCAKFVPHTLKPHEKDLQHSRNIIKEANKNRNFLYSIVTGDETRCFQYEPKRQSSKWQPREEPKPKKTRQEKSKIKSMLICFHDSKGIIYKEFLPTGQTVNGVFYVGVLKRLVSRIWRIRPEYREEGSAISAFDAHDGLFDQKSHCNHQPFTVFAWYGTLRLLLGKLHLTMKGKRYADVDAIQKASTAILNVIPKNDLKKSFDKLLDRANHCIQCVGNYFEGDQ